ncbi:isopeptide-forming domain-containing fimbrial protein [Enterococcus asini]|nr:isopeptide-forming domain-containing fimbrial protein [Enterococcus asini]
MRRRKLVTIILGIIMVLPLFLGLGGMKDVMAVDPDTSEVPESNQLVTLHKLAFDGDMEVKQNTGDEMSFTDSKPLAGAVFTAYDVSEGYWLTYDALISNGESVEDATAAAEAHVKTVNLTTIPISYEFEKTGMDGVAVYRDGLGNSVGLPMRAVVDSKSRNAIYLFKETKSPAGVVQTVSADFILGLPVYKTNDAGVEIEVAKENVHVYPKNKFKLVDIEFTKYGIEYGAQDGEETEPEVLPGAKFVLQNEEGKFYKDGAFTETSASTAYEFLSAEDDKTTTDNEAGKVSLKDAALEPGTYSFIEIDSSVAAGDQTETNPEKYHYSKNPAVTFTVNDDMTIGSYKYYDETGTPQEAGPIAVYNYKVPAPEKDASDHDVDEDQVITFTIKQRIPHDIADYSTFELVDTYDSSLSLISTKEEIEDQLEDYGAEVTIDTKNPTFKVTFIKNELVKYPNQVITFDVKMSVKDGAALDTNITNNIEFKNNFYDKKDKDSVKTFGKSFKKIDKDTDALLDGAKFYVRKGNAYLGIENGKQVWKEKVKDEEGNMIFPTGFEPKVLTSGESGEKGMFKVDGLAQTDNDTVITYLLEEIEPPEGGYVLLKEPIEFTADDGSVDLAREVANKKKGSLPSTGGSGIVAFVAIGVVAVAGAVLYFTKGRRQIEG